MTSFREGNKNAACPLPGRFDEDGRQRRVEETMRKFVLAGIAVAMMATPAFAANYRFVFVP
jgi:hypothetical protein